MKPLIKLGHRNGHVFLRIVRRSRTGRESIVCRLAPDVAFDIGTKMIVMASRAQDCTPKPKLARTDR